MPGYKALATIGIHMLTLAGLFPSILQTLILHHSTSQIIYDAPSRYLALVDLGRVLYLRRHPSSLRRCLVCKIEYTPSSSSSRTCTPVRLRRCGHFVGDRCIREWIDVCTTSMKIARCPLCRTYLEPCWPQDTNIIVEVQDERRMRNALRYTICYILGPLCGLFWLWMICLG
jgi:hypothetical protein